MNIDAAVADIHARFGASWPTPRDALVQDLIAWLKTEVVEIEQAVVEAKDRPSMRREVVAECGDAMLLLARIALLHGAMNASEPLVAVVVKTRLRLEQFEVLVRTMPPREAWREAKWRTRRG